MDIVSDWPVSGVDRVTVSRDVSRDSGCSRIAERTMFSVQLQFGCRAVKMSVM